MQEMQLQSEQVLQWQMLYAETQPTSMRSRSNLQYCRLEQQLRAAYSSRADAGVVNNKSRGF